MRDSLKALPLCGLGLTLGPNCTADLLDSVSGHYVMYLKLERLP